MSTQPASNLGTTKCSTCGAEVPIVPLNAERVQAFCNHGSITKRPVQVYEADAVAPAAPAQVTGKKKESANV